MGIFDQSEDVIGGRIEPRVRGHARLGAGPTHVEAFGAGVIDIVGVIAFDPLAAGAVLGAAEGAAGGRAAILKEEFVGEFGEAFGFAAARGTGDFMSEVVAFEPIVDGRNFFFIREANPGAEFLIEEEADVFEAFLDEGIGPGGELDKFAGFHSGKFGGSRDKYQACGREKEKIEN